MLLTDRPLTEGDIAHLVANEGWGEDEIRQALARERHKAAGEERRRDGLSASGYHRSSPACDNGGRRQLVAMGTK